MISQVANNLIEQNYPRCVFYKQIFLHLEAWHLCVLLKKWAGSLGFIQM